MRVLISGASISGPVLAYWLARHGFEVTVVERAPLLRKTGGHAVDLFDSAMGVVDQMGATQPIVAKSTGTDVIALHRDGHDGSIELPVGSLFASASDRHIEIMRDDLSEVFHEASAPGAEYIFGDSVTALAEDDDGVTASFAEGPDRRFDLVVGADGLHSNIRTLTFGPEDRYSRWLGEYLAVSSISNYRDLRDRMLASIRPNHLVAMYSAANMDDARALFLFRTPAQLRYHHRDIDEQKRLLRNIFGEHGWEVPRLLAETDKASAFYMDAITQLRMDTWSKGRVTLVGDAGYCPGPAVGGSTSLAVVGAYVLAGELARAGGDHRRAYPAYESAMADYVRRSRDLAVTVARTMIPRTRLGVRGLLLGARVLTHLPESVARKASRLEVLRSLNFHNTIEVPDYSQLSAA